MCIRDRVLRISICAVQSKEDSYKVLVTSPTDVTVSINEGQCVRVQGTIDLSQTVPTVRLATGDAEHHAAVLCSTETSWWQ